MEKKQRLEYIDTLKFLSIFYIFLAHFCATDSTNKLSPIISALHSFGITGKLCLGVLTVIMGFLAYIGTNINLSDYMLKRYFQFFYAGLFVNILFWWGYNYGNIPNDGTLGLKRLFLSTIQLQEDFNPIFWCISSYFVASIIARVNSLCHLDVRVMVLEWILAFIYWHEMPLLIADTVLGCIVGYYFQNHQNIMNKLSRKYVKYMLVVGMLIMLVLFHYMPSECQPTYFLQGIWGMLLVVLVLITPKLQLILSNRLWIILGNKNSMALFVLHGLMISLCMPTVFNYIKDTIGKYTLGFVITFGLMFLMIRILMKPYMWLVGTSTKYTVKAISHIFYR